MRTLDFSDGFTSNIEPNLGNISSSGMQSYASDAAYVAAKGSPATIGNQYYNSTLSKIRIHNGTAFESVAEEDSVVNLTDNQAAIGGNKTFTNDVTVSGNFTVSGTTTTINTATLDVEDTNVTLNKGGNDASAEGAGISIERTGTNGSLVYQNSLTTKFKLGALGSEKEIVDVSSAQTLYDKALTTPNAAATNNLSISTGNAAGGASGNLLFTTGSSGTNRGSANFSVNTLTISDTVSQKLIITPVKNTNLNTNALVVESDQVLNQDFVIQSGETASPTNATDNLYLNSGAQTGVGATGDTGDVYLGSGAVTSGTAVSDTGDLILKTGNNSGSGVSGDIILESGTAVGNRGNIYLNTLLVEAANNKILLNSEYNSYWAGTSGTALLINPKIAGDQSIVQTPDSSSSNTETLNLLTGAYTGTSSNSTGQLSLASGDITNALASGDTAMVYISSGWNFGSGNSGNIDIRSGDAPNGTAGSIALTAGLNTTPGNISLITNGGLLNLTSSVVDVGGTAMTLENQFNSYFNGAPTSAVLLKPQSGEYGVVGTEDYTSGPVERQMVFQTGANQVTGSAINTGDLSLVTGDITSGTSSGDTGQLDILTGYNFGTGNSGDLNIQSGNCSASGSTAGHMLVASGNGGTTQFAQLSSGNASNGNSGDVNLYTGTATGTRGKIDIDARVVDFNQVKSETFVLDSGITAARPAGPVVGQCWVDTTLGIPIWYIGGNWVDATGAAV